MALLFLSVIFITLYGVLIFYYIYNWEKLPEYNHTATTVYTYLSIIVPARNEEANIRFLLAALERQDYPKESFEVLVIDDHSTDNTASVVKEFSLTNCRLITAAAGEAHSSKKKAIETGIAAAKGTLIITTDADCIPVKTWLHTINHFYLEKQASFIAAPVLYTYNNTILQQFQAIDFLMLQGITAASVHAGFHTMCNGANLAYTKQSFIEVEGFKGIDKVASGDDMLLMYKIWKRAPEKVYYLKSREVLVHTRPMESWKSFFMQRKRWASKTPVYDDIRIIIVLGFVYLFNFLFLLLFLAALLNAVYWLYFIAYWFFKTLIEYSFLKRVARFYKQKNLMRWFFIFQPLHVTYILSVGLLSQWGGYEWKGRKTK